jgi:MFS family permease
MVVAFMQILDTSVTNVILPHLQGSLSAGLDEVSWVITSYLAANAVVIPATGWLAGLFGRKRFFLICTVLFVVSSFLSGAAPDLTTLIVARIFRGRAAPIIPLSQAILGDLPFISAARLSRGGVSSSDRFRADGGGYLPTSGRQIFASISRRHLGSYGQRVSLRPPLPA